MLFRLPVTEKHSKIMSVQFDFIQFIENTRRFIINCKIKIIKR